MERQLHSGKRVFFDEADAGMVASHLWSSTGFQAKYVGTRIDGHKVYMHRLLLDAPDGIEVDHINGDGHDNRRVNLRFADRSQNEQNKRCYGKGVTGVRGVYFSNASRDKKHPYRARLKLHKTNIDLGRYATLGEATIAAVEGRKRYFTHAPDLLSTAAHP